MRHQIQETSKGLEVTYGIYKNKQWHQMQAIANPQRKSIISDSESEFITEHYWGYTKLSEKKTSQYEVGHPSWDFYTVHQFQLDGDFTPIYEPEYAFMNASAPHSIFLAEGSKIFVKKGTSIS